MTRPSYWDRLPGRPEPDTCSLHYTKQGIGGRISSRSSRGRRTRQRRAGLTQAFWAYPTPENEAEVTGHLTLKGTRDQYVAAVPAEVAEPIPPETWGEDWRIMQLPGRMETQRSLIADYGNYSTRFDAIDDYLTQCQPAALMIWEQHAPPLLLHR